MIPAAFRYAAPATTEDALALLAQRPGEIKVMAGGQSLIPLLRLRLTDPETIVDLGRIEELRTVQDLGHAFRVGAMVTHRDLVDSEVGQAWPIIRDGGADLADPLVRNRGTFGGAVAHADPAGDWPPIVLALEATMHIRNARGSREVAAEEFFTELFTTAIGEDELLTHIDVPKPTPADRSAYVKFPHPGSGYAVAGAATVLRIEDGSCRRARITLTGIAPTPVRALAAEAALADAQMTAESIAGAAALAAEHIDVLGDSYAPENYRRNLITVEVRRALQRAVGITAPSHQQPNPRQERER
jgi:carbon-monoxide dehydrogenase medium subunit